MNRRSPNLVLGADVCEDCGRGGCLLETALGNPAWRCPALRFPVGAEVFVPSERIFGKGVVVAHRPENGGCLVEFEVLKKRNCGASGGFGWNELQVYRPTVWEILGGEDNDER